MSPSAQLSFPPDLDIPRLVAALSALARPSPVALGCWIDAVNAAYIGKAKSTRLRMAQALREVADLAGPDAVTADVGPQLVARLARRGGAASTTNGLLSSLRTALGVAVVRGWVRSSVVSECSWVVEDVDPPRARHHSRESIARVLASLAAGLDSWDGHRLYVFASVLAYAGLRKMEALRLKVGDVDLGRGFVFVRPNGRRLKTRGSCAPVPLPSALVGVLASWLPRVGSDWLIPNGRRSGPWVGGTAGRRAGDRLRDFASSLGVPGFTPHSLRHSLATHLAGFWGLSTKQVRMVLRHSADRTQELYIHDDLVNLGVMVRGFDFATAAPAAPSRRRRFFHGPSRPRPSRPRPSRPAALPRRPR